MRRGELFTYEYTRESEGRPAGVEFVSTGKLPVPLSTV